MLQSVMNTSTPIQTAIRTVFVTMDIGVYYLLHFVYELIFTIASINLLDREMIYNIFSRVQLVIGIFMMFRLIMIILKGIASPDTVSDSKSGGAGSLVMRIIVSLALLALIVPVSVPSPKNEYEKQINNNGILFGTLYSLQYRLLKNNTLGKLILGDTNQESTNETTEIMGYEVFGLRRDANRFTSTILKTFYQLNKNEETNEYVCGDGFDETYNKDDVEPAVIIVNAVQTCGTGNVVVDTVNNVIGTATMGASKSGQQYRLTINWLSTIVGIILLVVFFMLAFNVATRVFKLSALQLIAPIPIISYMDPKGSKDGAFQAWVKMLGTTYAELFIQLGVIYFSLSVINAFITRFFNVENAATAIQEIGMGDPLTATALIGFIFIIMVIALFVFAKDAPKFFKQMLGIKDDGKGFFSNFGTAMGMGVSLAGAAGSFSASRNASRDSLAARLRERNPNLTADQAQAMANNGLANRARHMLSGLFGAGAGLAVGSAAASESKGNAFAKMLASANAMNARNQKIRNGGVDGGSFAGAVSSLGDEIVHGESAYDRRERGLKAREQGIKNERTALKTRQDALKDAQNTNAHRKASMDRWNSKGIDTTKTSGSYTYTARDAWGNEIGQITVHGNARDFDSAYTAAIEHGTGVITTYQDQAGNEITKDAYNHLSVQEQANWRELSYFQYGNDRVYMASAKDVHKGIVEENGYDYYNQTVRFEEATNAIMSANPNYTREQAMDRVAELADQGNLVATLSGLGVDTNAHDYGHVIRDGDILGHRLAYREAMIAQHMREYMNNHPGTDEATARNYALQQGDLDMEGSAKEVKAAFGNNNIENTRMADELSREAQALSAREQAINDERQSLTALREKANNDRFKSGGKP